MRFKIVPFLLLIQIFNACIDPINIKIDSNSGNLVVEGIITDQPGPYEIRLSRSKGFFDYKSNLFANMVGNAKLFIIDEDGTISFLEETSKGIYVTPVNFKGEVGKSYNLNIELEDGNSYKSHFEKMMPNVGIERLNAQYSVKSERNELNVTLNNTGIEVTLDTNPIVDENKYYRWRFIGTYEIKTFPELHENPPGSPDPLPCSGYIIDSNGNLKQIAPCTCCSCWIEEVSSKVIVSKPDFISQNLRTIYLRFIENKDGRFQIKYHANVEQLSLTKEAHKFWSSIESQQNQGSLFDQPLGTLPTNIYSVENPEEAVIGYFGVSSLTSISRFMDTNDLDVRAIRLDTLKGDCSTVKNSINVKPKFW